MYIAFGWPAETETGRRESSSDAGCDDSSSVVSLLAVGKVLVVVKGGSIQVWTRGKARVKLGQFEATDVSGLPDWVQESIVKGGLNVLTFDEANASVLSFQVLIIGLAMYVSQQRYGAAGAQGQTQLTAEQMREERRRRSRFVDEPETLEDVDVSSWFNDDDDDDAAQRR